jgi:hypothetical protein
MDKLKTAMYVSGGALFSLGFYRGGEQFKYHLLKTKKHINYKDYANITTFAIINASLYVNPAFVGIILYDEYKKMTVYNTKEYYSNLFIIL